MAKACPQLEITSSIERNMELNAPGVSKGRGLMALAERLGLARDQVMAVGDSGNDLTMLEACRPGCGHGQRHPGGPTRSRRDHRRQQP